MTDKGELDDDELDGLLRAHFAAERKAEEMEQSETSPGTKAAESALEDEIASLLEGGKKIEAIKLHRDRTGSGLKEAKDAVEAIASKRHIGVQSRSGCLGSVLLIVAVLALSLVAHSAFSAEYPNELDGFKLYGKYCSGLEPMKSTVDDVRRVLGKPVEEKSGKFILWFEKDGWEILVYIYPDNGEYPTHLAGKVVESIDFISVKPVSFAAVKFPKAFNKADIRAADARWDEHYDAYGLVYEVYTSKPPYGDKEPGDLNRISYPPAPHKVIQMQSLMIRQLKGGK